MKLFCKLFAISLFVIIHRILEGEEMDEETETLLAADFEIGHFFRDRIIPRAVLYFTGEALEDEDDDYEEEEDEDGKSMISLKLEED